MTADTTTSVQTNLAKGRIAAARSPSAQRLQSYDLMALYKYFIIIMIIIFNFNYPR